jgi:hypothetical protein
VHSNPALSIARYPQTLCSVQAVVNESMKVPVHVWRGVIDGLLAPESDAQLQKVKTPTLIVWGDKENLFPRSERIGWYQCCGIQWRRFIPTLDTRYTGDVPNASRKTFRSSSTSRRTNAEDLL